MLTFFIFKTSIVSASTPLKYMQYDKLPCNFNGAKVGNSAYPRVERDKSYSYKINRCTKSVTKPKNLRSYGRMVRGNGYIRSRNTPIVAMRDMEFFFAKDYSAENDAKHKKQWFYKHNSSIQMTSKKKVQNTL